MTKETFNSKDIHISLAHDGSFHLSILFRGNYYTRHYVGYTLKNAVIHFRNFCVMKDSQTASTASFEDIITAVFA